MKVFIKFLHNLPHHCRDFFYSASEKWKTDCSLQQPVFLLNTVLKPHKITVRLQSSQDVFCYSEDNQTRVFVTWGKHSSSKSQSAAAVPPSSSLVYVHNSSTQTQSWHMLWEIVIRTKQTFLFTDWSCLYCLKCSLQAFILTGPHLSKSPPCLQLCVTDQQSADAITDWERNVQQSLAEHMGYLSAMSCFIFVHITAQTLNPLLPASNPHEHPLTASSLICCFKQTPFLTSQQDPFLSEVFKEWAFFLTLSEMLHHISNVLTLIINLWNKSNPFQLISFSSSSSELLSSYSSFREKLNELRREKQKLVEKIMDQYRVLDPSMQSPANKAKYCIEMLYLYIASETS